MAKVVVAKLNRDKKTKGSRVHVPSKRVRNSEGGFETVYTIDLASPKFELEFGAVFQSAVNKARKENKKVTGRVDVEPAAR